MPSKQPTNAAKIKSLRKRIAGLRDYLSTDPSDSAREAAESNIRGMEAEIAKLQA